MRIPLLDRASLDRMSSFYVVDQDRRNPLLTLAVAADLTGLPLDITAKVPHVFQSFAGILDEADEALDRAALFLRQRVRG
jgi:monoterpene epsilon-lactone hydrolase